MAAAVELELLLDADELGDVVAVESGGLGGEGGVEVVHVGLMVLFVVEFHDLFGDDGFEGLLLIRDGFDGEGGRGEGLHRSRRGDLGGCIWKSCWVVWLGCAV